VTSASTGLAGKAILITRPAARAARLAALVREAGAEPVLFPTLEILSISENSDLSQSGKSINVIEADIIVFVSPTAVEHGRAVFDAWLPEAVKVAAVGHATARALHTLGVANVIAPADGADSEALAALPEMQQVAGKRVLIVRGEGGRPWLADTLRARCAAVEYLECYRRVRPETDAAPLAARIVSGGIAALTITSREALDNLLAMLPADARASALGVPVFVVHPRLADHARALGARAVFVTGAGDEAMIAELQSFFAKVA
jgi:uroporphyrinogen-III synthase